MGNELRPILGIAALVALAAVMGCGGGSESPPSKEAFIRKANLSCHEGIQEKEELRAKGIVILRRFHGHVPKKIIDQYNSEMADIFKGEAERLADFVPPVGDEKKIEAIVESMYEAAEKYRADPQAGGLPFAKQGRMAEAYGIDRCAL